MKAEMLLGGRTRFAALEALADAGRPVTAYQVAMRKGLDPAATYRCLLEFSEFGIVRSKAERGRTLYSLSGAAGRAAEKFLRSLKQKTSDSVDLEEWLSPSMQSERMAKIARLDRPKFGKTGRKQDLNKIMSKRIPGELSALIASSKIAFDELFEQKNGVFVLRMR